MNPLFAAKLIFPLLVAAFCFWLGVQWQQGVDAKALAAQQAVVEVLRADQENTAMAHAQTEHLLSIQLGDARAQLRSHATGRPCLSAADVGVLNNLGAAGVPAAPSQPPHESGASATDQDVGDALAVCRSEYARIADQLNSILKIEDRRHPDTQH